MEPGDPPAGDASSAVWGPGGHAAVTAGLVAAGGVVATAWGAPSAEIWSGVVLAWVIQAASLWRLQRAVGGGRDATRPWLGSMAARLGGLGLVAVVAWTTVVDGQAMAVAYVATVVPLLWIEGLWLHRAAGDGRI